MGAIFTEYASSTFHREETLAGGGTENGLLRLYGGRVWDHPSSSGKNQGKLRINQPQLTLVQDDGRKRKFRVPRFPRRLPGVVCDESRHTKFPFSFVEHVTLLTLAQDSLRLAHLCSPQLSFSAGCGAIQFNSICLRTVSPGRRPGLTGYHRSDYITPPR